MRPLVVLGAGWYAAEVAGWAEDAGWDVVGLAELLDDTRIGMTHEGYRVVDVDEFLWFPSAPDDRVDAPSGVVDLIIERDDQAHRFHSVLTAIFGTCSTDKSHAAPRYEMR